MTEGDKLDEVLRREAEDAERTAYSHRGKMHRSRAPKDPAQVTNDRETNDPEKAVLVYLLTAPQDMEHRDGAALRRQAKHISIDRLSTSGFVTWVPYRGWYLTEQGKKYANS